MLTIVVRRIRKGTMLSVLIGMALVAVGRLPAQEKKTPPSPEPESLQLKAADADKVAATLLNIFSESKGEGVRISVDRKRNQVILQGTPEQMRNLIDALGDKRHVENYRDYLNHYRVAQFLGVPKENKLNVNSLLTLINDEASAAPFAYSGEYLFAAARDAANDPLGATLTPINDALRAQLKVPVGQGLLVAALRSDGPSALVGLKKHDILLMLGDHALSAPEDLTKYLKAAGESTVLLKVLRNGKAIMRPIRPAYRVTLGLAVAEEKKEYYLGVQLEALDDALRTQLNLAANKGVLVSSVVDKSPAHVAGVKPHDIILEYGGKTVENPETLATQVQAGQDRPSTMIVLREGKSSKLDITAATRNVASPSASDALRLYAVRKRALGELPVAQDRLEFAQKQVVARDKEADLERKIEDLRLQVQSLRDTMDRLNTSLKTNPAPKK